MRDDESRGLARRRRRSLRLEHPAPPRAAVRRGAGTHRGFVVATRRDHRDRARRRRAGASHRHGARCGCRFHASHRKGSLAFIAGRACRGLARRDPVDHAALAGDDRRRRTTAHPDDLMCGVAGVYGVPRAAEIVHLALYSLQHRGQESAGMVSVQSEHSATAFRAMGLVSDGLTPDRLSTMEGAVSIGHCRYSTAGSSTIENAQPVLARMRGSHIALAHNGNLVNATELRSDLESQGAIFTSTMDSEVIVHRLARATGATPEARLGEALQGVDGAYSLVVAVGDTLLAARDPRGWRPLVMGTLGDGTVFASETCALDIVGARYVREVAPGEIIAVDATGVRSI